MKKSELIKLLEEIEGDPNVVCGDHRGNLNYAEIVYLDPDGDIVIKA